MLNDVKILAVDNDCNTGVLYTALFENHSATVMTTESIEEALSLLKQFVPDILICEARFLGESVDPLIQRVRSIAESSHILIPIFVTSTFPAIDLAKHLKLKVEAYQIKPIDLDQFVAEVWNLILLSRITQPFNIHAQLAKLGISETSCCYQEVG
jgi:response regulator RpfG family c-di-GMP phosphodiesterase